MKYIDSGIEKLRDPFILKENGILYAYGTGWACHRNTTGRLDFGWEDAAFVVDPYPDDFYGEKIDAEIQKADGSYYGRECGNPWAPEVYKYNGEYYMFTTYRSKIRNKRGCAVFKADNPMGPFKPHSKGHITPNEWECIDATLHIDDEGKPWMVFVHEWTCMPDGIGSFAAARMSDDLSALISEPIELFKANSFDFTDLNVTDGCFMYRTKKGSLLMLWSNFIPNGGYAVAIARSDNGKIDGKWSHDSVLFSRSLSQIYEGGHGMIFEHEDRLWLSIHAPNTPVDGRREMPIFVPLKEENDTLVCKE